MRIRNRHNGRPHGALQRSHISTFTLGLVVGASLVSVFGKYFSENDPVAADHSGGVLAESLSLYSDQGDTLAVPLGHTDSAPADAEVAASIDEEQDAFRVGPNDTGFLSANVLSTLKLLVRFMDDEEVDFVIANILKDPDVDLQMDRREYLTRLLDIAASPEPRSVDPDLYQDQIRFTDSSESIAENLYQGSADSRVFTNGEQRIYAAFPSTAISNDQVIVKWANADSGEIMLLSSYPIVPYSDHNYVWFERQQWDAGAYQVDVYSPTDLALLYTGQYVVY